MRKQGDGQPESREKPTTGEDLNALLLDVDPLSTHEGEVELDRVEMQDLEVQVAAFGRCRRFGNFFRVLGEFPTGFDHQ